MFQVVGPNPTIFGQSEFKLSVLRFGPLSRGLWSAQVKNQMDNETIHYMAQHITVGPRISVNVTQPGHEDNLYTVGDSLVVRLNTNSTCVITGTVIAKADRTVGGSVDASFDAATEEFVLNFGPLQYAGLYKVQLFAETEDWNRQTNLQISAINSSVTILPDTIAFVTETNRQLISSVQAVFNVSSASNMSDVLVSAELYNNAGTILLVGGSSNTNLSTGFNTLRVPFNVVDLFGAEFDGPFQLRNIAVMGADQTRE